MPELRALIVRKMSRSDQELSAHACILLRRLAGKCHAAQPPRGCLRARPVSDELRDIFIACAEIEVSMENKWDLQGAASAKGEEYQTLLQRYKELLIESTQLVGEARPSHGEAEHLFDLCKLRHGCVQER